MSHDAESVMNAIQKSINLYLCMSKPNEDNEIKEQPIAAIAAVLLYNKNENVFYDVEMSYRDIFQKMNQMDIVEKKALPEPPSGIRIPVS